MTSVTGRALQESVRIVTKFSEMEETYSSLGSLGYDVLVDIAPEIKWIPDNNAYKNLKIVVEMDSDIDAHTASEQEFRRRYKSIGALKVVTDRAKGITLPSSIKQGHTIWIYACALYLVVADTMKIFTD
ncbi:hypothetical protein GLYMA_14G020666v4 [Glycine max]|nr:hypothetical protein GLYMA_14G020666v4 [Glycine max]